MAEPGDGHGRGYGRAQRVFGLRRLAKEFRSLGANLLVTPQADPLPLEIGGVDYRPANAGTYLREADLGKLKRFSGG